MIILRIIILELIFSYILKFYFNVFFNSYFILSFLFQGDCINYEAVCPVSTDAWNRYDLSYSLYIYSQCLHLCYALPTTSDKSSFSSTTHSLLLLIFFITNLLLCNGIHHHPTIYTLCKTYWRIPYYASKGPGFFFSLAFIYYLYFYFFILNLLICEGFGHVDRLFIISYGKDIGSQWTIVDYESNVHNVTYNMDIHSPLITEGWNDLRSFYADKSDKLVLFKYIRNSSF